MPPEHEKVNSAPPGAQQHQREPVDVLVGARRALGMGDGRRELRRVEDDRVERFAARRATRASVWLTSASTASWRAASKPLRATLAAAAPSAGADESIADHVRRAAGERGDAEAAGVAVAVEHALDSRSGAPRSANSLRLSRWSR